MSEIPVPWKKIVLGLPKIRRFADDRAQIKKKFGELRNILTEGSEQLFV